jgi:hypothetical protein
MGLCLARQAAARAATRPAPGAELLLAPSRAALLGEGWEKKRADASVAADCDDAELVTLEKEFLDKKFFDKGLGYEETRVIVEINWSVDFSRFMADTRKLDPTGKRLRASKPSSENYYGLSPAELPEMRRMISDPK